MFRAKLGKTAMSQAFANFGPDFKIDWQQINRLRFNPTGSTNMSLFEGTQRQDFYSWLFGVPSIWWNTVKEGDSISRTRVSKREATVLLPVLIMMHNFRVS